MASEQSQPLPAEPKQRLPLKHCRAISAGQAERHRRRRAERAAAVATMRDIGLTDPAPSVVARGQRNGRRAALVQLLSGERWMTLTEIRDALACPSGSASGMTFNLFRDGVLVRRHRETAFGPVYEYRASAGYRAEHLPAAPASQSAENPPSPRQHPERAE